MSKIFKPEIVAKFESQMTEADMLGIERSLQETLKLYQLPYTRHTLKTMLMTLKQLIRMGGDESSMNMTQVFYGVTVERCLERLEKRVSDFKSDLM